MRALVVAVVSAAVLTGCGTGGGDAPAPGARPTPGPGTVTPAPEPDHELVAAALRKTRAAKTATFVIEGTNELLQGELTLRREGSYDLARGRAAVVQTLSSDPPGLLKSLLGKQADAVGSLDIRSIQTRTHAYLRMPALDAKTGGKWLTLSQRDLDEGDVVGADLDGTIFPVQLEMLAHAQASPGDDGNPSVATVAVPAEHVFAAIPSSTPRKMVAAGLDPAELTGTVEVEVTISGDGLIARVEFDAIDVFVQAAAALGQDAAINQVSALPSFIDLSAHGAPAKIAVPPPAQRITSDELAKLR